MRANNNLQHAGPPVVHLREYWKIIWHGRYTVLGILVLVVGAAVLRVLLSTPIYQASAMVQINPEARRILPGQEQWVGAESGSWLGEEFYFNTQLEVLKSRDLAARVLHRLRLQNHPRFAGLADPAGAFASSLIVKPKVNTRLVAVSMNGPDPREITEWVNTYVETYEQRNVDDAAKSFAAIMDEIEKSLSGMRESMGEADLENLNQAASENLFVPENQDEILKGNLERYNTELTAVTIQIGALEADIQNLERVRESGEDVMALPKFSGDATLAQLTSDRLSLERELELIKAEKRPQHPDYVRKSTELKKIEQRMDERTAQITGELREQHRVTLSKAANLIAQIRRTEEGAHAVHRATAAYGRLRNDADSKRKVYDVVAETMNRFSLNAQLLNMNNNVSILDKAIEPRSPIRPRKAMTVAFGLFFGLLAGIGAVLFLDYLDNTIRSPEDVEQYLGLNMLAVVPRYRGQASNAVREAFQSLRTGILFSSSNREKRVVLFSSAGPKEGKSSTVAQVAAALASAGDRVVIVDCDLRRPTQHHHNTVPREPGLTNYLLDGKNGDYEPFIQRSAVPNLFVLACGPIPPNPPELVGTKKFSDLLKDLKDSFDWVVVDSPPVANLADSVVLASLCDMMLIVIRHNENDRDLIRRCLKRLADVDVEIAGAVLNAVDVESSYYSRYYYGNYYYDSDRGEEGKTKRRRLGRRSRSDAESTKVAL